MRRTPLALASLAAAALTAAALAVPAAGPSAAVPSAAPAASSAAERGAPGTWTRVSSGTTSTITDASLYRTSDRVLHVLYPRTVGTDGQLGHTAVSAGGTTVSQSTVLASPWSTVDDAPALVGTPDGGLRAVFGGLRSSDSSDYYSQGRMYTATAPASGASWTLSGQTVGNDTSAYGSYGTAATTLADGTPVAAFPLSSTITWHVGTGSDPDQSFSVGSCCVYDLAMVRSGSEVWIGWYGNGGTSATNGTFVRRILPTLGPVLKAPLSAGSSGTDSSQTGRVALAARSSGGVYAAYCSGSGCPAIRLWKVGASSAAKVATGDYYAHLALAPAPGGRLWLAWSDGRPRIKAVRSNTTATRFGAVRDLEVPSSTASVYAVSLEGSTGRGDVVINNGKDFWHTQALAGLTVSASPSSWRHGTSRTVRFTVTDAGARVGGARVTVGSRRCTTASSGSAAGQCSITFPSSTRPGRLTATATKTSYGAGSTTLRVS